MSARRPTLASQADRIREMLRRVRTLSKRLRAAETTAQLRAAERDQAMAEVEALKRQRLALAKLASPIPQFYNPLVVWETEVLRDDVLAGRVQ